MEIEPRIPGRLHGRPATFQSWSSWKDAWCCYFVIYLISNPICFCKWLRYILEHISIEYLNDGAHYYSFFFQIKAGQQKLKMIASSSWTKIWDERKNYFNCTANCMKGTCYWFFCVNEKATNLMNSWVISKNDELAHAINEILWEVVAEVDLYLYRSAQLMGGKWTSWQRWF